MRQTEIACILRALQFAAEKHRDQRRKGEEASPYINHPIEVARVLVDIGGVVDPVTLQAAILHDTVEDTDTTLEELEGAFGAEVARIVAEVSDDRRLKRTERRALQVERAARSSPRARLVKLADKIANVRDILEAPPAGWPPERRREYVQWAREVVERLRGTNAALEAHFERLSEGVLEALAEAPG